MSCMCACVPIFSRAYVCMHAFVTYVSVCMCELKHACECVFACMYLYMYVCIDMYTKTKHQNSVCMYKCIYVYMCVSCM